MSDIRYDPLTDAWILIASIRALRPEEFTETHLPANLGIPCPFCAGNEDSTPRPTLVYPHGTEDSHWTVRVVPNRYPAVEPRTQHLPSVGSHPLFETIPVVGGHEVIVESPDHIQSLSELHPESVGLVFEAYAERMRFWNERPEIEYTLVFKNVGAAAGASLRHLHSQLIATSRLPPAVAALQDRLERHRNQRSECMLCEMLSEERRRESRIVIENEQLVAFCPFASYLPYLVRIAPLVHHDAFEHQGREQLCEVGMLVQRMIYLLEKAFPSVAYNFFIQSRPTVSRSPTSFHWWIDIFPRITKQAGFEWGCGGQINPIAPEQAAAHLRKLDRLRTANQYTDDVPD